MIKAVVFDYGGVIELKEGDLVKEIADSLGITKEEWQKKYFSFNHLSNVGKVSTHEVFALVCKELGASHEQTSCVIDIINKFDKKRILNLGLLEIIRSLKEKKYKIGLISNYSAVLREKLVRHNIIDLFDAVVISNEVGYQKPQPEIFEKLFEMLGVENFETIIIDDTPNSLRNSDDIGYIPLLYTDNKKLKKDLLRIL